MKVIRLTLLLVWTVPLLLSGCRDVKGFRWDWWKKDSPAGASKAGKSSRTAPDAEYRGGADEAASRPASTQTASAPVTRRDWSAPKPTTLPGKTATRRGATDTIETPILMVNDEVITVKEILDPIRDELIKASKEMAPSEYRRFLGNKLMVRTVMNVDQILAYGEAKKEVTDDMEAAIKKAVDQTEQNRINTEFGGRLSRYEAWLEANGEKREDVRKRIRRELLVRRYLNDKFLPLLRSPVRQELWKYYQSHPEEFTEELRVEMFLIDVPYWAFLEGTPNEDRQAMWAKVSGPRRLEARRAAQQHMDKAMQEIKSGISFEAVARSYSRGPNAAKGGAWGFISPGGLTGRWTEVAEALFRLKSGEISDIVRTDDGLFVVKAGQRFERRVMSFVEAQPIIEKKLVKEQRDKLEAEFLNKLRRNAAISDVPGFFKALSDAAPKQPGQEYDYKLDLPER